MLRELESEQGRSEAVDNSIAEAPITPEEMFQAIMTPLALAHRMACGNETAQIKASGNYVFRDFAAHAIPRITRLKQHADRAEGQRYAVLAVQQITKWLAEIRAAHGEEGEMIPGRNALLYESLDKMRVEVGGVLQGVEPGSGQQQATDFEGVVGDAVGALDKPAEALELTMNRLVSGREDVELVGVPDSAPGEKAKES